jgi:ABC-type branched-subunit amino acid transport system substrate-binding protein
MLKGKARSAMFCLLALLLLALPLLAAACGDDDEDKTPGEEEKWITIGGTFHLTGPTAPSTGPTLPFLQNMIKYMNEVEGGIDGIKIKLVWADDGYNEAKAAIAYKRMRDQHHPLLWAPPTSDTMWIPVRDLFERDMTPVLATSAYTLELFDPPSMFFTFRNSDANIFTGLVRWVLQDWEASGGTGKPKLAHLHWDMPYGNASRDGGGYKWAEEYGVDIIDRIYPPGALDLRPQLLDLKGKGADYVFMSGMVSDATLLIRDARATGMWDDAKFIIDHATAPYIYLLPIVGEDAEGLYQVRMEEPWTAGPEVAKAHRLEVAIREWGGYSASRLDGSHNYSVKLILTAVVRQAVADVGYENLNGEAMFNALEKLDYIDTLGGYHNVGWGPDNRMGQSGIKIVQYRKMAPGSEVPPDGIMMETVAVSDWMETTNIFVEN